MNLANTIIPKSDQLNADDLMVGPRTIQITEVRAGSVEQPVSIGYEGDNGRPYKPGKSMRRVLVAIWGEDSKAYIGRRLTLYRDDSIRFGSDEVGGIRISHASHIAARQTLALTVARGKRKPYTVEPLPEAASTPSDLPDAWNGWGTEERGIWMAGKGTERLKQWWTALSKSDREKHAASLAGWKATAEKVAA